MAQQEILLLGDDGGRAQFGRGWGVHRMAQLDPVGGYTMDRLRLLCRTSTILFHSKPISTISFPIVLRISNAIRCASATLTLIVSQGLFAFVCAYIVKAYAPYAAGSGISEIKCILAGFMLDGFLNFTTLAIKSIALVRHAQRSAVFERGLTEFTTADSDCFWSFDWEGRTVSTCRLCDWVLDSGMFRSLREKFR